MVFQCYLQITKTAINIEKNILHVNMATFAEYNAIRQLQDTLLSHIKQTACGHDTTKHSLTHRRPLPLDLPAQLAHLGGADGGVRRQEGVQWRDDGGVRQRERRVRPRHAQLPVVVLRQLLVAIVLRHEGVGGQRLGYLLQL